MENSPDTGSIARREPSRLRRWLHWLRFTPFHPQFLAYRHERARYRMVGAQCVGRVLDIGCGRQPLRDFLPDRCEYIGLDHPETGTWYQASPSVSADASCLPFADQTFDTIVCLEVLEHLPCPNDAMLEARRVLKPGGRLIISTPFLYPIHDAPADYQRWTRHGLEALARTSGFRTESLIQLGTPIESGSLVFNLGWAWQTMNAALPTRVPLGLLAVLIIPMLNLVALLHSRLECNSIQAPFAIGYVCVLTAVPGSFRVSPSWEL